MALDKLLKQKEQLENQIKLMHSKTKTQTRKDDSRRKILVGTYVLEKYDSEDKREELIQELDRFLFRTGDRILFGLPPRVGEDKSNLSAS